MNSDAPENVLKRGFIFGVPVDLLTMDETVDLVRRSIHSRRRLHHVALNVAKLVNLQTNPDLRRDVVESDIVGVDGMGIVWGARLLDVPVPERVTGVDLMGRVLDLCASESLRPYFFGAAPDVLGDALSAVRERWPTLEIAGSRHGYFNVEDEADIVAAIRDSRADCLFVAISTPIKEQFCRRHRDQLGVPFVMGVGGSFDILAGKTRRAPYLLQRMGFEWAYRLACEPRRMWRRYLFTNARFAYLLTRAFLNKSRPTIESRTL